MICDEAQKKYQQLVQAKADRIIEVHFANESKLCPHCATELDYKFWGGYWKCPKCPFACEKTREIEYP